MIETYLHAERIFTRELYLGAYTLAQLSRYNSRTAPTVLMVTSKGKALVARRGESYEDLIARDTW